MCYDKTVPGWGNGDSERACDVRAGNCTDFHSFFMSLARAKGIPTRFVIGFSLPSTAGLATGYHCWAEFHADGTGWIPVDISDAAKSTAALPKDYWFGNLDARRVQFTIGRDIQLHPAPSTLLNYFIYPHAEADGRSTGCASATLE